MEANNRRFSLAASWEDFDNDGDQDLYVANDFGRNNLYVNEGGHFRDLAAQASAEDQASGMSVAWGDFGHDGTMDLYVGNMFSMAGNRISNQQRFSEQHDSKTTSLLQRMARGNSLLENHSRPDAARFVDVSIPMNVTMGRWSWASPFVDLNADGWLDIVVANGYLTNPKLNDL